MGARVRWGAVAALLEDVEPVERDEYRYVDEWRNDL